jgi:hypothetical protein
VEETVGQTRNFEKNYFKNFSDLILLKYLNVFLLTTVTYYIVRRLLVFIILFHFIILIK